MPTQPLLAGGCCAIGAWAASRSLARPKTYPAAAAATRPRQLTHRRPKIARSAMRVPSLELDLIPRRLIPPRAMAARELEGKLGKWLFPLELLLRPRQFV